MGKFAAKYGTAGTAPKAQHPIQDVEAAGRRWLRVESMVFPSESMLSGLQPANTLAAVT